MKKTIFAVIMIAIILLVAGLFSGCASLEKQGYPSNLETVAANAQSIAQTQQPHNDILSQKMDKVIDLLAANLNKSANTPVVSNGAKKAPKGAFRSKKPLKKSSRKAGSLENRLLTVEKRSKTNSGRVAWLEASTQNRCLEELTNGGEYEIEIVGNFPAGVSELQCDTKGCNLEKQIEDMVVEREIGYTLVEVEGCSSNDGNNRDKDVALARAETGRKKILAMRPGWVFNTSFKVTTCFGTRENARVLVFKWVKK